MGRTEGMNGPELPPPRAERKLMEVISALTPMQFFSTPGLWQGWRSPHILAQRCAAAVREPI